MNEPPRDTTARSSAALALSLLMGALVGASCGAAQVIVPDPTLTPGAPRTTDADDICSTPTRELRHWNRATMITSSLNTACRPARIRNSRLII
jgi:hypothetical protein